VSNSTPKEYPIPPVLFNFLLRIGSPIAQNKDCLPPQVWNFESIDFAIFSSSPQSENLELHFLRAASVTFDNSKSLNSANICDSDSSCSLRTITLNSASDL